MRVHTIWVADHVAFSTKAHTHDYYQLVYCRKAGGSFEIDGKRYVSEAGQIYLIQPMQPHAMQRGDNMQIIELKFLVDDENAAELLRRVPSVFTLRDDVSLRLSLKDIVKEGLSRRMFSNDSTNAALELLLIRILREFIDDPGEQLNTLDFDLPDPEDDLKGRNGDVQFIRLINYIDQHLSEHITLELLSDFVHFNKSYLTERFKDMWGIPPMKYVNGIRIERAKELLAKTDKSITVIAEETGFSSIHYFSRYFKEKEHMTPQAYRAGFAGKLNPRENDPGDEEDGEKQRYHL